MTTDGWSDTPAVFAFRTADRAASVPGMLGLRSTLALVLAIAGVAACGQELPTVDCATPAVPTYAMVNAFRLSCTTCHSSTLVGASRFGAPQTVNFDTYAAALPHAEEAARRVFAGDMPRTGTVSAGDKQDLYRWALCGTPP